VKKIRTDEVMKHLMLLKNGSDKVFNASTPRFIASSLSTLNESMLKSPNNNNKKFSDTCESKDDNSTQLCYINCTKI
jgi:hypothetical protein